MWSAWLPGLLSLQLELRADSKAYSFSPHLAAAFSRKQPMTIQSHTSYMSKHTGRSSVIKLLPLKYVTGSERMWHPAAVQLFTASVSLHESTWSSKSSSVTVLYSTPSTACKSATNYQFSKP